MPLFKVCDVSRTKRKAVVANSLEELIAKGKKKLRLEEEDECFLFEEHDGTEVDDDERLLEYDKGTSFVLGSDWIADLAGTACTSSEASPSVTRGETPSCEEAPQEHAALFVPEVGGVDEVKTEELATSWQEVVENEKGSKEKDVNCSISETIAQPEEKKVKSLKDVLMRTPYHYAKAKNIKIFSPQEIDSATGMERTRRKFWNEKADQLAKNKKTSHQSKTVLSGLIDVSWTLRKTSILEAEAKKLQDDERVLFGKDDVEGRKLGTQKKGTILKNVERMSAAHHAVEELDQRVKEIQEAFKEAKVVSEREKHTKEYERKKRLLDGAYTELKRAQDALSKSMKVKKTEIQNRLKVRAGDVDAEVAVSSSLE